MPSLVPCCSNTLSSEPAAGPALMGEAAPLTTQPGRFSSATETTNFTTKGMEARTGEPHAVLPRAAHRAVLSCNSSIGAHRPEGRQVQVWAPNTRETPAEPRLAIPFWTFSTQAARPKALLRGKGRGAAAAAVGPERG